MGRLAQHPDATATGVVPPPLALAGPSVGERRDVARRVASATATPQRSAKGAAVGNSGAARTSVDSMWRDARSSLAFCADDLSTGIVVVTAAATTVSRDAGRARSATTPSTLDVLSVPSRRRLAPVVAMLGVIAASTTSVETSSGGALSKGAVTLGGRSELLAASVPDRRPRRKTVLPTRRKISEVPSEHPIFHRRPRPKVAVPVALSSRRQPAGGESTAHPTFVAHATAKRATVVYRARVASVMLRAVTRHRALPRAARLRWLLARPVKARGFYAVHVTLTSSVPHDPIVVLVSHARFKITTTDHRATRDIATRVWSHGHALVVRARAERPTKLKLDVTYRYVQAPILLVREHVPTSGPYNVRIVVHGKSRPATNVAIRIGASTKPYIVSVSRRDPATLVEKAVIGGRKLIVRASSLFARPSMKITMTRILTSVAAAPPPKSYSSSQVVSPPPRIIRVGRGPPVAEARMK